MWETHNVMKDLNYNQDYLAFQPCQSGIGRGWQLQFLNDYYGALYLDMAGMLLVTL